MKIATLKPPKNRVAMGGILFEKGQPTPVPKELEERVAKHGGFIIEEVEGAAPGTGTDVEKFGAEHPDVVGRVARRFRSKEDARAYTEAAFGVRFTPEAKLEDMNKAIAKLSEQYHDAAENVSLTEEVTDPSSEDGSEDGTVTTLTKTETVIPEVVVSDDDPAGIPV